MASFQQQPPTRIKLRRDAIIHAIAWAPTVRGFDGEINIFAVGDDEALTIFDAATDRAVRRFEDVGTVLSVCFLDSGIVAAGTLRGLVALRRLGDYGPYEDLALAPASSEREGVRAIAAATTSGRVAAGDAAGRVCVWFVAHSNPPDVRPLFALKAARDRTCAVEALALQHTSLVVARSALGSTPVPLLSVWGLNYDDPPEVTAFDEEEEEDDDDDDEWRDEDEHDEYDPWHPTLRRRLFVNYENETVDVHAVARSDPWDGGVLVAGAADGSVAAWKTFWDAGTRSVYFQELWRGSVGASVQAIALAAGSAVIVPIGVGAAAAPVYLPKGDFADRVALAPPARKPIGGANNCDGCGTPALVWDGSVQQGCPVCSAGTVVNACALARDGKRLLAGGYDRSLHAWDLSDLDSARS